MGNSALQETKNAKRPTSSINESSCKRRKLIESECTSRTLSSDRKEILLNSKGHFFKHGWTEALCRCKACTTRLKAVGMLHVFDDDEDDIELNSNLESEESENVDPNFSTASMAGKAISQFPAPRVL